MELPQEIQDILQKYRPQRLARTANIKPDDEFIDVGQLDLSNDETWLCDSNPVENLSSFFKCDNMAISSDSDTISTESELNARKTFDSRTFTRPKKLNRPSIEKYNEEYFADELKSHDMRNTTRPSLVDEIDKYMAMSSTTLEDGMTERPLHFDLSQPVNTSIFERILTTSAAAELDSFQNMSPPSLVNSMCSSTFTNLMDNSYIKNDPVLREIRDADYSSVIYQELEPPLYQSITESCSSINTDVAETFVRKTLNSLNCTFNKSQLDDTLKAHTDEHDTVVHAENIDPNATYTSLNGTYKKNKSLNRTFEFDGQQNPLDATFEVKEIENNSAEYIEVYEKERLQIENLENDLDDDHNSTFSLSKDKARRNTLNNTYKSDALSGKMNATFNKRLSDDRRNSTITIQTKIDNYMSDINEKEQTYNNKTKRLSDEIDEYLNEKLSNSCCKEEKSLNQYSAESTDSLDRLSSISNSSRESKLMAEVDAIVERQERSLQQVMSTPNPRTSNKLFEAVQLSPIPLLNMKEHVSDSEVSSEEYTTVRSKLSSTPQSARSYKSLSNLKCADSNKPKSAHTMSSNLQKPETIIRRPSSSSNLRQASKISGSYSNLKTFSSNLKGSYTNLRPRSMVLPNIPPKNADGDVPPRLEEFKVPAVPPNVKEPASNASNGTFVKPKISSLPRPVTGTGIPRPASKIPGPRTSRLPLSKTKATSRTNLSEGYY